MSGDLFVVGINHRQAKVDLLEKFNTAGTRLDELYHGIRSLDGVTESAVLSTCNRMEVYAVCPAVDEVRRPVVEFLSRFSNIPFEDLDGKLYFKKNSKAVEHLFRVASGLDSMALGETEILGQVKTAYEKAQHGAHTGKSLNRLFQKSLQVAKRVRTETDISHGRVGIASIAVDLSRKIFMDLSKKRILLVGSGQMARSVLQALVDKGIRDILIANRNTERAHELVREFGGQAVPFDEIDRQAVLADIVIASTAAPKAIIGRDRVGRWMNIRKRGALFIIDLSVPRNVDTSVSNLEGVYRYDLDDLRLIAEENLSHRREAIVKSEQIIEGAVSYYLSREHNGVSA